MRVRLVIEASPEMMRDIAYECSEAQGVMDGLVRLEEIEDAARTAVEEGDHTLVVGPGGRNEASEDVTVSDMAEEYLETVEGVDYDDLKGIFAAGVRYERDRYWRNMRAADLSFAEYAAREGWEYTPRRGWTLCGDDGTLKTTEELYDQYVEEVGRG